MSRLARMQVAIARMLMEPEHRRALFEAAASDASRFDLTAEELATLQRIDPRTLSIASEGYAGKRFERVAARYPLTLETLASTSPGARWRYLASTRFARSESEEWRTFETYVRALDGVPEDAARLLRDLIALETAWTPGTTRPLPVSRETPGARLALAADAHILTLEGPLGEALRKAPAQRGRAYPAAPSRWLVLAARDLDRIDAPGAELLDACSRGETFDVAGKDAASRARLRTWIRAGAVVLMTPREDLRAAASR